MVLNNNGQVSKKRSSIPLASPSITKRERDLIEQVLNGTTLSAGPMLDRLESLMAEVSGRKYAVATNSGTSALHLIVKGLGLGKGDAVITTPFSFVASSNCLLYEDVEPVFVDIESETLNIDPVKIRQLLENDPIVRARVKGILAVDVFGHPADWDALDQLAEEFGLVLIDDSAEAVGSSIGNRKAGGFGDAGVFAFYPNKQLTMGEGGALLTDNPDLAEIARSYRNQGRAKNAGWLSHDKIGYNYRLSELHAALGVAQFERIDEILSKRSAVFDNYSSRLSGGNAFIAPVARKGVDVSWFTYAIRLNGKIDRDSFMTELKDHGVPSRVYFPVIHLMDHYVKMFGHEPGQFPIAESASKTTVTLPFFTSMTTDQIDQVCEIVQSAISAQIGENTMPVS